MSLSWFRGGGVVQWFRGGGAVEWFRDGGAVDCADPDGVGRRDPDGLRRRSKWTQAARSGAGYEVLRQADPAWAGFSVGWCGGDGTEKTG